MAIHMRERDECAQTNQSLILILHYPKYFIIVAQSCGPILALLPMQSRYNGASFLDVFYISHRHMSVNIDRIFYFQNARFIDVYKIHRFICIFDFLFSSTFVLCHKWPII